jgi:hypothetical protein
MKQALFLLFIGMTVLVGCRSRVIQVTITNTGREAIRNIEVQYPGGSYGVARLQPGTSHQYRIKPLSAATMQFSYEDSNGKQQIKSGPRVEKGQEGTLDVTINGANLDSKLSVQ